MSVGARPICDFCGEPEPRWRYTANGFRIGPILCSPEDWLAGGACHALIKAGDREGLSQRSMSRFAGPGFWRDQVAAAAIPAIHGAFLRHRIGGGRPVGGALMAITSGRFDGPTSEAERYFYGICHRMIREGRD